MKYSRSAITQLTKWYRQVLIKCAILNAALMTVSFSVPTFASDITGVTPNGNTYNIEGEKFSGSTQFRQYNNFTLDDGDIANLIYKEGHDKFVNLVDSQVNINGIVNTMRDNNFFNGHAIFVSPNGIVVGASGVLNVGSLTLAAPSQSKFDAMKNAYVGNNLSAYEVGAAEANKYDKLLTDAQGNIVINGKIMARGNVEAYGKNITVEGTKENNAGIIAGVQNQNNSFTNKTQAEQVFNTLVNTNIKQANSFSLEGGKLKLVASASSKANDDAGNIKAEIDIKNANLGADEIDISAKAEVDRQERIDLAQAIVNIENSSVTGNTVSAVAEASQNKSVDLTNIEDGVSLIQNTLADLFDPDKPGITSLWGTAGKAEAEVNVNSSVINAVKTTGDKDANSIVINAIASSTTNENANLLTPTILEFITNSDEAKISEYFSNDIYSSFEGAKSSAIVNVDRSVLSSKGTMGIDITSIASSSLTTDQAVISFIMPFGLYGVGTETISQAIVKNSLLNSNLGRVNVDAVSTNTNDITVSNSSLLQLNIERSWLAVLLNNNVKTQTESLIENSIVNATFGGLQVFATNLANSNVNLDLSADTGLTQEGSEGAGNSGAAVVGVLNRSDNDVSAIIKDSTVNTYGNVCVMADSLNITGNSASASTYDYSMQRPASFDGSVKDKMKALSGKLNINLFDKIKGINTVPGTKETLLQGGGAFVWSVTDNNTTAKIENSTVNTAGKANNVTVQATTVDLMKNNTYAESAGEEKIGMGLAVIYNDETNTTTANIDGSTVNAKSVVVDAQTELPMNMGQLSFGLKLPFKIKGVDTIQLGGNFASEANGKWDISFADPINVDYDAPDFDLSGTLKQNVLTTYENLKPKAKISGFFNNLAKTQTKASTAAIAGSVVYNEVKNNTTADITNESKIMLADGGSLVVNAVNSVIGYNAAGMIDFLIKQINYKIPGQADYKYQPQVEAGTFGLGFNFLWNDYNNNATAKIENSSVVAPNGSVDVRSATEQAYITITMTGGKAKSVGIDGSIHNQILEGTTLSSISNTTKEEKAKNIISAKTVNVNAGKAKVRTAGGSMTRITPKMITKDKEKADDDETKLNLSDAIVWYLSRNTERDAEETITNIIAQGAWTTQSSGSDDSSSVGIAVGASVNVTDIDRSVKAEINNYVMSADDVTVDSDSLTQSLNIEIAAAFSGGVDKDKDPTNSTKKTQKTTEEDEENINKKLNDEENGDENTDNTPLPKPDDGDEDDNLPNPKNPGELSDYEYEGLKAMGYSDDEIEEIFSNNYNSQFYQNKPDGMTNAKYRELVQEGYSDEQINYYQGMIDGGATEDEIQQYLNTVGDNIGGRNPGGVSDYIYYNLRQMGFTDEEIENAFSNNGGNIYPNKPDDMDDITYLKLRHTNYTDEEIQFYQGMLDSGMTEEEVQDYFYNHSHSPYVNKPLNMDNETYLNMREANYTDEEIWTYQGMIDGGMSVDEAQTELNALNYSNKPDGMSNDKYRELRKYYTDDEIEFYQGMIDGGATDEDARIQLNNNQMYPGKPADMSVEKYRELRQLGYSDEYINYYQGMIDAGLDEETVNNYFVNNASQSNQNQNNKYPYKPEGMSDATYEELVAKGISDNRILHYQMLIDQGYSPSEALKIATAIRSDGKNPGGLTDEQYRILHDERGLSDDAIEEYFGSMSEEERNAILGGGQQVDINPYPNKPAGMSDEKYQSLKGEGFSDAEIKVFQELLDAGLSEAQIKHEMRGSQNNSGDPRLDNLSKEPNPNNPGGISDWLYQFYKDGGFTDEQIRIQVEDSAPQQGESGVNSGNSSNNNNDQNVNAVDHEDYQYVQSFGRKIMLLKSDAGSKEENTSNRSDSTGGNDTDFMKDPTGGTLNNPSSAFTLSAAGAVNVTNDDTKVESSINYSNINVKNSIKVDADRENKMLDISGGVAGSKKIGAGAAVNVYEQGGSVKSHVDDSNITFLGETPTLDVTADNTNGVINIAIGVGAATNDEQNSAGIKAAAGGSASANVLKPEIDAYVKDSATSSSGGKIDAKLEAKNDLDIYNIAGGGAYSSGASAGVSAGAAINYNNINNTIHAYVENSTLDDIKNLDINAQAENDLMEFAVAGAIMTGTQGSGLGIEFAGSANIDYIHDVISAQIINSTVTTDNDVNLRAESDSENLQVAGSFDYSSAKTGVGVNGSIDINQYENNIFAQIDANSKILKANNVNVSARSEELANVIPVGLSISTDKNLAMLAATVGVNIIDNSVRAYIRGDIGTDENKVNNVNVVAYDETTLYTRGGTLAVASADTTANIGGSFNRDLISKTVEAKIGRENATERNEIKAAGDVSVSAASINSLGGTKNSSGSYDRNNINSEEYNNSLMQKDSDGYYSDLNYDNSFQNWNMFYNFSVGAKASIAGAVIVKTIEDAVKAEVAYADITANNLNLMATNYSVKNILAGQIAASSKVAVGAQVLITDDESETSSLISNQSKITLADTLNMTSWNRKDNMQIVVAANASGKAAGGVNVLHNTINDTNIAEIADSTVTAENVNIGADEDINSTRIVVGVSGSANVALNVSPLINYYGDDSEKNEGESDEAFESRRKGKTISRISNSTVNDAAIMMNALTDLETQDIGIGAGGAGSGFAAQGVVIKNVYDTITKSVIDKGSSINTVKDVALNADSVFDASNWVFGASGVGTGFNAVVNVIINDLLSKTETDISDSEIKKAGKIALNTNKGKKDEFTNFGIAAGFAAKGASAVVTTIYNLYNNYVVSKINNTSVDSSASIETAAYSDRDIENVDISLSVAAIGGAGAASALVNEIDSTTVAYVDAKSKQIETSGALSVKAEDNTFANNKLGFGTAGGLAVAAGANVNLYTSDNLAKAEVLSDADGKIEAQSADISSKTTNGLENTTVGVAAGLGGIAADVQIIKIGKENAYSQSEQDSKISDAISRTKADYDAATGDGHYNPEAVSAKTETGSQAKINGNLTTVNNTDVKAESKLKGKGADDKLSLTNVSVMVGGTAANVAVRDVQLANNTKAEIAGGNVESTSGDISVNAESKTDVEIDNTEVTVSAVKFGGGSAIYDNTSNTIASVGSADRKTKIAAKDINVTSNSVSNSSIEAHHVSVVMEDMVGVNIVENTDQNNGIAQVTGLTDIEADGKLNVHSTVDTDLHSSNNTVKVSGISLVSVLKNNTDASTVAKAVIENMVGSITAKGIDLITDYNKMSALSEYDITSVSAANVASYTSSKVTMDADFTSGIYKLVKSGDKLIKQVADTIINNLGALTIKTAQQRGNEKIKAESVLENTRVSIADFYSGSFGEAENTAKSNTYLKTKENNSNLLTIDAHLDSLAKVNTTAKGGGAISVKAAGADAKDTSLLNIDVSGTNNITGNAIINAAHNASVSSELEALNVGLAISGNRIRIDSTMDASTTGNIGGDFNARKTEIEFNTVRDSKLSKSLGSGGVINVSDTKTSNKMTGNSVLNVSIDTDESANNNLDIKNTSTNTFDVVSSNGGGGLISVSVANESNELTATTTTNIINSKINSKSNVEFNVENNTVVKDSAAMSSGGFVDISSNKFESSYTSGAKLSVQNSEINAEKITLNTSSDIRSAKEDYVDYVAKGGGFVAGELVEIINTLEQDSEIELKDSSKLNAVGDTVLSANTSSGFKQRSDNDARGFVAIPKTKATLKVTNTNKISIDGTSEINAGEEAIFNFDSNNKLESRVVSKAKDFAGAPRGESWLNFTVNNTLENKGDIHGGQLVDVNYMANSKNDLTNYVYTQNDAAVAKTFEDGNLSKTVNNSLNISEDGKIASNENIEVTYGAGRGDISSRITWDTTSYIVFGIPIHDSATTYPTSVSTNNKLKLDGEIAAGEGNSKYMKINRDGSLDLELTSGFSNNDYILGNAYIDGEAIRQDRLDSLTLRINDLDADLQEVNQAIAALEEAKAPMDTILTEIQTLYDRADQCKNDGYTVIDSERFEYEVRDFLESLLIKDDTSFIFGAIGQRLSQEKYDFIEDKYNLIIANIQSENDELVKQGKSEDVVEVPSMIEFLNKYDDYKKYDYNDYHNNDWRYMVVYSKTVNKNLNLDAETISYINAMNDYIERHITSDDDFTYFEPTPEEIEYQWVGKDGGTRSDLVVIDNIDIFSINRGKKYVSYDMGTAYKTKVSMEEAVKPYNEQIAVLTEEKNGYDAKIAKLQNQWNEVNESSATDYGSVNGKDFVRIKDIAVRDSSINIQGITNHSSDFSGSGKVTIAAAGVKVDNYSTRTVILGNIDLASGTDSGLIINGKNFDEFANNEKAVNGANAYDYKFGFSSFGSVGTSGAHYETGTGITGFTGGVTVNNYYDNNHPFINTFDIENATATADIFFLGDINAKKGLNVLNESGDVIFLTGAVNVKDKSVIVPNGNILLYYLDAKNNPDFTIDENDYIFAGKNISLSTNGAGLLSILFPAEHGNINIKGTIKSGYANRSITITEDMIKDENLIFDPTSGQRNLINLGGNALTPYLNDGVTYGNIKAIYQDGQIYLYNLPEAKGGDVVLDAITSAVSGSIITADGYQNITIDNKTDAQLNVGNITNNLNEGGITTSLVNNLTIREEAQVMKNAVDYANTNITSKGKLVLDGVIENHDESNFNYQKRENGILNITADNGLEIKQQKDAADRIIDSIVSYGTTNININEGQGDINGNINSYYKLNIANKGSGDLNINGDIKNNPVNYVSITPEGMNFIVVKDGIHISDSGAGDLNINGNIEEKEGNVTITNSNAGALNVAGNITDEKGDIEITNSSADGAEISGEVSAKEGNITIDNAGDKLAVSGSITDENGNILITNDGSNGAEFTDTAEVSNTKGNTTITNNKGNLTVANGAEIKNLKSGNMAIENKVGKFILAGLLKHLGIGNLNIKNSGNEALDVTTTGNIEVNEGNIDIQNSNSGALNIAGNVVNTKGTTTVANTSADGMKLVTTGQIHNSDGNIEISNTGVKGMTIEGKILADKQDIVMTNKDSDLIIGEFASNNDNYVETEDGDITINQQNGNVLNGIVDTSGAKHQNADFGTPEQSYKTLLATNGDLNINATDGNIGHTDNERPGFTIEASTRDWTDSVNVNVSGVVNAQAINNNKTDNRLVNIRAKDSDLNIHNVSADGNVILTAADWKQADIRPTPDDEAYFTGYSVSNAADDNGVNVSGQNISVIASNNIGEKGKKLTYLQDTATDKKSSVSFEAENDLYVSGKANSDNETQIYQIISKHGTLDLDLASNATINEISAGKELILTQKAQNMTIMNLGMPAEGSDTFTDMLNPHDDLIYGYDPAAPEKSVVPQNIKISVLDAVDTPERSDSNLKIYSATVRGSEDESKQSDVTLMADNIYVNSAEAPDSDVSTKDNPNGYKQTQKTYSDEQFGGSGTIYEAKGINTLGEGGAISLNVSGVDADFVAEMLDEPQRSDYEKQYPVEDIPSRFYNSENSISDYGFRAKNAVVSVNDYADTERGVEFDTLYADNAYINTMDTNLTIHDAYINNYAEFRNGNRDADSNRHLAVVDNDYRRLVPSSNVQLYTQQTGSFGLSMDDKIKFHTMAPIVHYDWDKLVNTFSDENSFVRLGLKETEIRQKAKYYYKYGNVYVMPETADQKHEIWSDHILISNVKITDISRDSAIIVNRDNWKIGDEHTLSVEFDDVKADIRCKVISIDGHYATVKFLDMPASVYNKLIYKHMKMANK